MPRAGLICRESVGVVTLRRGGCSASAGTTRPGGVQVADRRLVVVEGKGGHHRVVPAANRFFVALGTYLHDERPAGAGTDRVSVVLKGPRRGLPLSVEGLDEILAAARRGPGWSTRPATSCGTRADLAGAAAGPYRVHQRMAEGDADRFSRSTTSWR